MVVRQSTLLKADKVKELKGLLSQYTSVGIASLQKVRAAQLQKLSKKLEKDAHLCVVKNSLITRAVSETKDKAGIEKLEEYLTGPNLYTGLENTRKSDMHIFNTEKEVLELIFFQQE